MSAVLIAKQAVAATAEIAKFVSPDIREKLAIAEVAIVIDGMDESISASVRIFRLQEAIIEVRAILKA